MNKVFLSYRRADTKAYASHLYDYLVSSFGKENVFIDIDTILPGDDFEIKINHVLAQSSSVVVLIGREWLKLLRDRESSGKKDHHLLEIQRSLAQGKRIVPVLVDDAPFPDIDELPEEIKDLASRHYCELRDTDWNHDVNRLIALLGGTALASLETRKAVEEMRNDAKRLLEHLKEKEDFHVMKVDVGEFVKGIFKGIFDEELRKKVENDPGFMPGLESDAVYLTNYFRKFALSIGDLTGKDSYVFAACAKIANEVDEREEEFGRRTGMDEDKGSIGMLAKLAFNPISEHIDREMREMYVAYLSRLVDTLDGYLKRTPR